MEEEKQSKKKLWLWISVSIFVLFILGLIFVYAALGPGMDAELSDDSDLQINAAVPEGENGYDLLEQVADLCYSPEEYQIYRDLGDFFSRKQWAEQTPEKLKAAVQRFHLFGTYGSAKEIEQLNKGDISWLLRNFKRNAHPLDPDTKCTTIIKDKEWVIENDKQKYYLVLDLNKKRKKGKKSKRRKKEIITDKGIEVYLHFDLLAQNEPALKMMAQVAACSYARYLDPDYNYSSKILRVLNLRYLSNSMLAKAMLAKYQGEEKQALDYVMTNLRCSGAIAETGPLIHYFLGASLREVSLAVLRNIIVDNHLTKEQLLPYIKKLEQCRSNKENVIRAYLFEYKASCAYLEDILSGRETITGNRFTDSIGKVLFMKPNRTKNLVIESYGFYIGLLEKNYVEAQKIEQEARQKPPLCYLDHSTHTSANQMGQKIYSNVFYSYFSWHYYSLDADVIATQTLIALKCYQKDHGKLPVDLKELVPQYLPKMPYDVYDGKYLKYSAAKKQLWSAGNSIKKANERAFSRLIYDIK